MPGFWDVFISHTQRNAEAKSIADRLCASLGEHRITVWLDVNMMKKSVAAMQEGVTKSTMVIAIITGACKNRLMTDLRIRRKTTLISIVHFV